MQSNFSFDSVILVQDPYRLDLHNSFNFVGLNYSIAERSLVLQWQRGDDPWVQAGAPAAVSVTFSEVSEFRFMPRDNEMPYTEDDCVADIGYWKDEDWLEGIILTDGEMEPDWLRAFVFQSGAMIAVQAASMSAVITP